MKPSLGFKALLISLGTTVAAFILAYVAHCAEMTYAPGPGVSLSTNAGRVTISGTMFYVEDCVPTNNATLDDVAESYVDRIREAGVTAKVISLLISNGEFCKARGHTWQQDFNVAVVSAVYIPPDAPRTQHRTCSVCGAGQTKTESDWHF